MNAVIALKITIFLAAALLPAPFIGKYLAKVFSGGKHLLSFLSPAERFVYRAFGLDAGKGMDWKEYSLSLLAFNAAGLLLLMGVLMLQGWLPLNPRHLPGLSPHLAFNTAMSFVTNTNWQAYSGETTMSYLSQALGLATQNFASAATGAAVAVALSRAFAARKETAPSLSPSLGNFWADLVRADLYVLLPLSLALSVALLSQGVPQSVSDYRQALSLEGKQVTIPLGPAASQVAIKQLGSNGGGYFGVNSAHPFENPTPLSDFLQRWAILLLPAAFPFMFGALTGRKREGWAIFAAMALLLAAGMAASLSGELGSARPAGPAALLEGKETRIGTADSALWDASTTAVSSGSTNNALESGSALMGLAVMANMLLGEVVFGGVGAGLYGMILFAILAVFIAGLMVGRGPEYLGRRIEAREVKLSILGILAPSAAVLVLSSLALMLPAGLKGISAAGPRGFSEVLYGFASAAGNNGSAYAGLGAGSAFYCYLIGICIGIGRYAVIFPALAVAGSIAAKRPLPESSGSFRTATPAFAILLAFVVLIVGGLTFFPALSLGPIVELAAGGRLF
jgi:potassium-transporting ATPase potassium-binding subunit